MSKDYLLIEGSGLQIHSGDVVTISDYGDTKWIVKKGWYKLGNAQKNGWYFISIADQSIVEADSVDLDTVEVSEDSPKTASIASQQDEHKYIVIPGTNIRLYDGDIVKFTKYPRSKWIVHCGWYILDTKQNFGWYFVGMKNGKILPIGAVDLKTCTLVSTYEQGSVEHAGPETNYTRPFTESDMEILSRSFITLDTLEQRDNLDQTKLIDGKMIRVNDVDGTPEYYIWNAYTKQWELTTFGDTITRLVGTYTNPIILSELESDTYVIYGEYKISPNDSTTRIATYDILAVVNREEERSYIKIIDDKSIFDYIVEEDDVVLFTQYATTAYIETTYATYDYVDSKIEALEAYIDEVLRVLDERIREIAQEEDRLYSTNMETSFIENLFN